MVYVRIYAVVTIYSYNVYKIMLFDSVYRCTYMYTLKPTLIISGEQNN